jgi:hypothetical protein
MTAIQISSHQAPGSLASTANVPTRNHARRGQGARHVPGDSRRRAEPGIRDVNHTQASRPARYLGEISAVRRGNLVAQTASSRRAKLDVLRPVAPAGNGPANALALPVRAAQAGAQARVVTPQPRQVLLWRCGPRSIRRSRDVTVGYHPGGASRRVRGRTRSPGPLARSGRRRRSWQPTAAPPRVRARRRA